MSMNITDKAKAQFTKASEIPGKVLDSWPVWIGFGIVNMGLNVTLNVVRPLARSFGGPAGMLVNALVSNAAQVTQFIAWDALKTV